MSDSDFIDVVGNPPPYNPPFDVPGYTGQPGSTGGPPPAGTPGGPPPANLEGRANLFSANRVKTTANVDLNDPKQKAWVDQATQVMKTLFFNTQFGEKTKIEGPGNKDVTEEKLTDILNRTTIELTTSEVTASGAKVTQFTDPNQADPALRTSYVIYIDVDNPKLAGNVLAGGNELMMNFVLFHEIGHLLDLANAARSEMAANTYAVGIADYSYMSIPSVENLNHWGYITDPLM